MSKEYQTIRPRFEDSICYLQLYRPESNNTINNQLIAECNDVLTTCENSSSIVIMEGLPDVFCFGADFKNIQNNVTSISPISNADPAPMYELWQKLAAGPYISIAHVRGKANAGGIGFVAACDIVLAEEKAEFSLSELLFGLFPACVLPFLIRRIGIKNSNYLTLMTKPISAQEAKIIGLVDAFETNSESLLRKHLLRLRYLSKHAIKNYKNYIHDLSEFLDTSKEKAIEANKAIFSDPNNLSKIARYVETGKFPWED